jgi:cytochrome P450
MGGGGHACLGGRVADIEMKLIIALLLRRYELTPSGPAPEPTRKPGISRPAGPCPVAYRQLPQQAGQFTARAVGKAGRAVAQW